MNPIDSANITAQTRVFVCCDLDVPIRNGRIDETYRLEAVLPTLLYLKQFTKNIIIAGHLGKPKGQVVPELSTQILKPFFDEHLGSGNYELMENLRFDPREETNDPEYARELASKADIYVNEIFSTSHRKHASIIGIPRLIPSFAGKRLILEVVTLKKAVENPKKPLVAIIGGAKVESKLPVINKFLRISDAVLIGGKLGMEWKQSIPDNMFMPKDYLEDNKDIGPETVKGFAAIIQTAKTIIWAGPMGAYEEEKYAGGTRSIAEAIVSSPAFKIAGGGDTLAALNKFGYLERFDFVSTGGGAMLEFIAKGTLPGLEALDYHG